MYRTRQSHRPGAASLSRRAFVLGSTAVAVAGCQTGTIETVAVSTPAPTEESYRVMYGPLPNERFPLPAVDISKFEPQFLRREVSNPTGERPGTIVVDTTNKFLYLTLPKGRAMRYGVGLGRAGFGWDGEAVIRLKREWPTWTPPPEMIDRDPDLEQYRDGMPPGPRNPLGARALYLFQGGQDTLYRLHGTAEAYSIGRNVSSGCVRLLNHDIIDLYSRTPMNTRVVVRPAAIY
ncbi:L,D-transpeptidase [Acuticoccus sp. I52.16.1]|uniref:L,D-transpeptidase n=1 Tax=Acuticoccus sp. I52.16.1 TaxID=2928472 RepID=UPI001FD06B41|nr:L,D-transpeptidase [Acuticoccus sp. I52.16.1]UOM35220.1 L,D-transpeptidase [Acuticoccus sp. I52.16.1]